MKKAIFLCFSLLMLMGFANVAGATVLTFDDISASTVGTIPDGYGGFDWDVMGYLNGAIVGPGSGYDNGTVSGDYVAFNLEAAVATVSGDFDFNGAYFTAAWSTDLSIGLLGYSGNTLLYNKVVGVSYDGPTWVEANFLGIDKLILVSLGGLVDADKYDGGKGAHFAMDNFTFNEINETTSTSVPEPATMLLLGTGLVAVAGIRRKVSRG